MYFLERELGLDGAHSVTHIHLYVRKGVDIHSLCNLSPELLLYSTYVARHDCNPGKALANAAIMVNTASRPCLKDFVC